MTRYFEGLILTVLVFSSVAGWAAPIVADFSGTISVNNGVGPGNSTTFNDFPGGVPTGPQNSDIDSGLVNGAQVRADAQDLGDGTLTFGQTAIGSGLHDIDVQSIVSTSFTNAEANGVHVRMEYNILPGFLSIRDYIDTFSGLSTADSFARFEFSIAINGVDVVLADATATVSSGGSGTGSLSLGGASSLFANNSTVNQTTDTTVSKGRGETSFNWDFTSGLIDLGLIAPGQTVDATFSIRAQGSGTTNCGNNVCATTGVSFDDPPGFRTMALRSASQPNPFFIPPAGAFPDIYTAVNVNGAGDVDVVIPPTGPGGIVPVPVPEPSAFFLMLIALGVVALRRRRA